MLKKYGTIILISFLVFVLILGFLMKDSLNEFISEKMQEQTETEVKLTAAEYIQKNYNFQENGQNFEFTFLEFSSSGCAICKQMEPVLEEIKQSKQVKVKVVFLHIMNPENLDLMKYYGISAVPMQILLDKQGNEFFRHYGFISAQDLITEFSKI